VIYTLYVLKGAETQGFGALLFWTKDNKPFFVIKNTTGDFL